MIRPACTFLVRGPLKGFSCIRTLPSAILCFDCFCHVSPAPRHMFPPVESASPSSRERHTRMGPKNADENLNTSCNLSSFSNSQTATLGTEGRRPSRSPAALWTNSLASPRPACVDHAAISTRRCATVKPWPRKLAGRMIPAARPYAFTEGFPPTYRRFS